jgi:hypothetical protein
MSDTATMWRERVAGWRVSGETAAVYSARHGFTTSSPMYWSCRLRREDAARAPVVRLAQLVRAPQSTTAIARGTITIELLDVHARVTVAPEVDREMLAAVLAMLDRRDGR